jgi:hypothetical protein
MKRPNDVELTSDSNIRAAATKDWRQPSLRKLPIAATAGSVSKGPGGNNDGMPPKGGGDVPHPS